MNRRSFLQLLGIGVPVAAVAPTSGILEWFAKLIERCKPVWTVMPPVHLPALHSVDLGAELAAHFAQSLRFGIDREILGDLDTSYYRDICKRWNESARSTMAA